MKQNRVEVALTGGIGCGKSEVARFWSAAGIPVLDTDQTAHHLMEPGQSVYRQIVESFGETILGPDGEIDRSALGDIVFSNPEMLETLNRIVHPVVEEEWINWMKVRRGLLEPAVVSIPLLFEAGAAVGWGAIVCISAPENLVIERLLKRGLSKEAAVRRIKAQLPLEEKRRRSDYVINNDQTLNILEMRAMNTWQKISK